MDMLAPEDDPDQVARDAAAAAAPPAPMPASGVPAPMAPPAFPATPAKSVTDRESTTATSRTKVAPQEMAAQQQLDKDAQAAGALAQRRGQEVGVPEAQAQAEAAQRKQEILQQHGPKLQKLVASADAEFGRHEKAYTDAVAEYSQAKPTSFWEDDTGGKRKFWAGIAMALGGFGASRVGGHNLGFEQINTAIEQHDQRERERIAKLRDVANEHKTGMDIALTKKHEGLTDLMAWKTAAWDQAASQLETRLAALGTPKAQIDADENVLKAREQRDAAKAQWSQVTRQEIRNQVTTKTQQIVGGPAGAGATSGGRAQGKMMEYGLMGTSIADGIQKLNKLPIPPPADLQKVQDNDRALRALDESHGTLGLLMSTASRKTGLAPRSRFRGVSEATAEWVRNQELVADKVAEVLGQDKESKENFRRNLIWGADDTPAGIRKKISQSQEFGQKAINLAQQYGGVAANGTPGTAPPVQAAAPPGRVRKVHSEYGPGWFDPATGDFQPDRQVAAR